MDAPLCNIDSTIIFKKLNSKQNNIISQIYFFPFLFPQIWPTDLENTENIVEGAFYDVNRIIRKGTFGFAKLLLYLFKKKNALKRFNYLKKTLTFNNSVGKEKPDFLTGCFKANLDTLTYNYDKYSMCTEKIMVDLFSVYPEISFDNNKSEKIT